MFGKLLKQKDTQKNKKNFSKRLYAAALLGTRKPEFYTIGGVPDSFDGRFEILLVYIFLILHTLRKQEADEEIAQNLFDEVFKDMDQILREMGIGDMGIPKHMRRMMKAFNGRMHAYEGAIDPQSIGGLDLEGIHITNLNEALRRNLYGTCEEVDPNSLSVIEKFVRDNLEGIRINHDGDVLFVELENGAFTE